MDYKETYEAWLSNPYFDAETKQELESIAGDENEIKERFYADLEFGTARRHRDLPIILSSRTDRRRVWQSLMIHAVCHRSLQMRQHVVWRQMALRHMCLSPSDLRRSFPLL